MSQCGGTDRIILVYPHSIWSLLSHNMFRLGSIIGVLGSVPVDIGGGEGSLHQLPNSYALFTPIGVLDQARSIRFEPQRLEVFPHLDLQQSLCICYYKHLGLCPGDSNID